MAPTRWTTPEQLAFLRSKISAYLEARKTKRYEKFWARLELKWFEKWPEVGLSEAVDLRTPEGVAHFADVSARVGAQKDKLKAWFRNNAGSKGRRVSKKKTIITIGMGSARKRRLRIHEMYSRMVYKNQIQSTVADRIRAAKPRWKGVLPLITSAIKGAWEAESDEVKQTVLDAVANQPAPAVRGRGAIKKTPKAYARVIDEIPNILTQFFEELSEMTGWVFEVICGGPDPQNEGRLRTLGFHRGESMTGLSFSEAYPGYQDNVLTPYSCYLKDVFPIAVRNARALRPEDNIDESDDESDGDNEDGERSGSDSSEEEGPAGWWVGSNIELLKSMSEADTTFGPEDNTVVASPGSHLPDDETEVLFPTSGLNETTIPPSPESLAEGHSPSGFPTPTRTLDLPVEGPSPSSSPALTKTTIPTDSLTEEPSLSGFPALTRTASTWPDALIDPQLRGESSGDSGGDSAGTGDVRFAPGESATAAGTKPPDNGEEVGDIDGVSGGDVITDADEVARFSATVKGNAQVTQSEVGPPASPPNAADQLSTIIPKRGKKRKTAEANDRPEANITSGRGKRVRKPAGPKEVMSLTGARGAQDEISNAQKKVAIGKKPAKRKDGEAVAGSSKRKGKM